MANIQVNKKQVNTLDTQLSTQKKINKPSEDPIIAIRALRLRASLNEVTQYLKKNIPDAQQWLSTTQGALTQGESVINKLYEYCNQGSSDSYASEQRNTIAESLKALKKTFYDEGNVDYAGRYVFTGYKTDTTLTYQSDALAAEADYTITQKFGRDDISSKTVYTNAYSNADILNLNVSYDADGNAVMPNVESVSVVPVGLSRYREGLYPLEPFNAQDAGEIIDLIEKYQKICMEKYGTHFIQASDEWYILAGREVPEEERYDGYLQLENGVGMIRLLLDEFHDGLKRRTAEKEAGKKPSWEGTREISLATGRLAFPYLKKMSEEMMSEYPGLQIHVYEVINEFFGELITVSGLLTGQDIVKQLKDKNLGEALYLPRNVLRSGADLFLDDYTLADVEGALQVPVNIVKSSGYDLVDALLGEDASE